MPEGKFRKGFVDPLSIISLGFLLVSLVVGTAVISKSGLNFDIRKRADVGQAEYPTITPANTPESTSTPQPTVYSSPESLGCTPCNCSGTSSCPYGGQIECNPPVSCTSTPTPKPTIDPGTGQSCGDCINGVKSCYNVLSGVTSTFSCTSTSTSKPTSTPQATIPSGCSSCSCSGISTCPGNRIIPCKPPVSCKSPTPRPNAYSNPESLGCAPCNCSGISNCPYGGQIQCTPPDSCKATPSPSSPSTPNSYICTRFPSMKGCENYYSESAFGNLVQENKEYYEKMQKACGEDPNGEECQKYQKEQQTKMYISGAIVAVPLAIGALTTLPAATSLLGNLALGGYSYLTAALTTAPTWLQTALSVGSTAGGLSFVGGGTAACLTGNQEGCFAYLASLQGDPTSFAYAEQTINDVVTAGKNLASKAEQTVNSYLEQQINKMLPENISFAPSGIQPISPQQQTIMIAEDIIRENPLYWQDQAINWTNIRYERNAAANIYPEDYLSKNLFSQQDPAGVLQGLRNYQVGLEGERELYWEAIDLIEKNAGLKIGEYSANIYQPTIQLDSGETITNPLTETIVGVHKSSIKFIDTTVYDVEWMAEKLSNPENYFGEPSTTQPNLFISTEGTRVENRFVTLLHEYGHEMEVILSNPTQWVFEAKTGISLPAISTSEVVAVSYGIEAGTLLAPLIGPEAAARSIVRQLVRYNWITTGSVLPTY